MRIKARLENFLFRILPAPVFVALVRLFARLRNSRARFGNTLATLAYRIRRHGNSRRSRIVNLDMYNWTRVNLANHIRNRFGKQTLLLQNPFRWNDYETDKKEYPLVTEQDYAGYTHEGLLLWEMTKVSIMKHLGRIILPGTSRLDHEELACIARYYAWAINCYWLVSATFDRLKPDIVLLTQGGVYDSRIIAELARKRDIRAIALENSFSSEHFYADALSGQILNRHTIGLTGSFINECDALDTRVAEDRVMAFFNRSMNSKSSDHRTGGAQDPDRVLTDLSIPAGKKILLFLGQVRTDASTILDSTLYPDSVELIKQLVEIANRNPDYYLIIRLHPKEETTDRVSRMGNLLERFHHATLDALYAAGIDNTHNIKIVSDRNVSTYALMKASHLGITINSQSGLEMLLLGVPVITAGRCFYAHHGFTWDLARPELLEATIMQALKHQPDQAERKSLISYCHYLFFDYLITKDLEGNVKRLHVLLGLRDA